MNHIEQRAGFPPRSGQNTPTSGCPTRGRKPKRTLSAAQAPTILRTTLDRPNSIIWSTQRYKPLCLRPFRVDDAAAIAESCKDPDIPRFTMMPEDLTEATARDWVEQRLEWWTLGLYAFAITLPPSDRCVGQVGLQLEAEFRRAVTFYWLDRRVRGRGIATESLNLVTDWGFAEHDLARVHLVTHLDNPGSERVAQRCGYQREGILRAWEPVKNEQPDVVMWSRLPA